MNANKLILPGAIGLATLAGGGVSAAIGNVSSVSAATNTGSHPPTFSSEHTKSDQMSPPNLAQGGHIGANGVKEVVLTGQTAVKAKAAAEAAVPGATIIRVETDADGATYEAHLKKPNGSIVTVKMDASFKVTAIDSGMGGGGPGPIY